MKAVGTAPSVAGYPTLSRSRDKPEIWRAAASESASDQPVRPLIWLLQPAQNPVLPQRFRPSRSRLASVVSGAEGFADITAHGLASDGRPYLVLAGEFERPLTDQIQAGPTAWEASVDLVIGLARTTHLAHDKQLILGDLRPDAIWFSNDEDQPRIVAWGMSTRHFDDGSPTYLAPEAQAGQELTPAADTYSLVLVLAAMISGRPKERQETAAEYLQRLRAVVPDRVAAVLKQGLAASPENRYGNGHALAAALEAARRAANGQDPVAELFDPAPTPPTIPELTPGQPPPQPFEPAVFEAVTPGSKGRPGSHPTDSSDQAPAGHADQIIATRDETIAFPDGRDPLLERATATAPIDFDLTDLDAAPSAPHPAEVDLADLTAEDIEPVDLAFIDSSRNEPSYEVAPTNVADLADLDGAGFEPDQHQKTIEFDAAVAAAVLDELQAKSDDSLSDDGPETSIWDDSSTADRTTTVQGQPRSDLGVDRAVGTDRAARGDLEFDALDSAHRGPTTNADVAPTGGILLADGSLPTTDLSQDQVQQWIHEARREATFTRARTVVELFWFRTRRSLGTALVLIALAAIASVIVFLIARELQAGARLVSTGDAVTTPSTVIEQDLVLAEGVPYLTETPATYVTARPPRAPKVTRTSTSAGSATSSTVSSMSSVAGPTTEASARPTTARPTTTERSTTTRQSTSARPTTTRRPITTHRSTTVSTRPPSTEPPTTARPTTAKPTTTARPTTAKPTTTARPTTAKPTTTDEPSSSPEPSPSTQRAKNLKRDDDD